ncbi:MAG: hypothetical protein AAGC63_17075 [Propionicimonas sp.]|nr:hypothetical protein [Propionicimonas sp.]
MIRLRRLPPTKLLRRPVYEVESGPSAADPAGWTRTTTTPATLIDTQLGVAEAWALVAAADAAWTRGTGAWVSPEALSAAGAAFEQGDPAADPLAGRGFQLWEYGAGHGGLLVRSPKGHGQETNVDVVFDHVEFVSCPKVLPELAILPADPDDLASAAAAVGELTAPAQVFVLGCQGRRHLVVASACRVIEHVGSPIASPFDPARFSRDWWADLFGGDG